MLCPRKSASPIRRFNSSPEIIRLLVLMYVRFPLSLRDVEDLPAERGIDVCHETVRFWWNRFGPLFASDIRRQRVDRMRGFHANVHRQLALRPFGSTTTATSLTVRLTRPPAQPPYLSGRISWPDFATGKGKLRQLETRCDENDSAFLTVSGKDGNWELCFETYFSIFAPSHVTIDGCDISEPDN